jgi:hypothetical protein
MIDRIVYVEISEPPTFPVPRPTCYALFNPTPEQVAKCAEQHPEEFIATFLTDAEKLDIDWISALPISPYILLPVWIGRVQSPDAVAIQCIWNWGMEYHPANPMEPKA